MSTDLLERPANVDIDDDPHLTHIVLEGWHLPTEDGPEFVSTHNSVIDGKVFGQTVKALCGFEWVPDRNPHRHPPCPACFEIARERGWKLPTE